MSLVIPRPSHGFHFRLLRWPLFVLLSSIGLTAYAAFEAQRAVRAQHALARRALHDYAEFAAWSYEQHLVVSLSAIEREAIGAVNHGDNTHIDPRVPSARDLANYLPWDRRCGCRHAQVGPDPQAFFAVSVRDHRLNLGLNAPHAPGHWVEADARPALTLRSDTGFASELPPTDDALERDWLLDSLTARVRRQSSVDHGFTFVVGTPTAAERIFSYTLMPTAWGDTMIYGARYSRRTFATVLARVLDEPGLLPETFTVGRRNREVIALRVADDAGRVLFASDSGSDFRGGARLDLPARAGSIRVEAVIRPEVAGSLLIGGSPRSRLPFLLGLLGLAAALSIVAVAQLRREIELARVRGDFVSSVSHELRTPLAQIRLYVETLRLGRAPTPERRDWALGHIERETMRLSHLVEKVLRFSTLGQRDEGPVDPIDVVGEVRAIITEFLPLATAKNATIVFESTGSPRLRIQLDALRHIVFNLLDNAVKYGPSGQTIRVSVRDDAEHTALIVHDEGPGIAAHEQEAVWRPFTRGKAVGDKGGSGIGLTIVREVAAAYGGEARIETGAHAGARMVVTFPAESR